MKDDLFPKSAGWSLKSPSLCVWSYFGRKVTFCRCNRVKARSHGIRGSNAISQGCGFPSGRVCMWELDYKESWALKNRCFWTVMLEKTLESPLDCKEIHPVHPKGNQSWMFIGKTDVETETPILWPPDAKNWLIWKDPDAGKDWTREEKGMTEDEMVGMASPTRWTWFWLNSSSW